MDPTFHYSTKNDPQPLDQGGIEVGFSWIGWYSVQLGLVVSLSAILYTEDSGVTSPYRTHCIVICTAATLYVHRTAVDTAEQAPMAGEWARYLFSAGLIGASLLAASVLPLSTTYAICEAFGWERELDQRAREAPMFYGLYAGIIGLSALFVLSPGMPLFSIMWLSQSMNAILLPVLLVLVLRLANDRRIMRAWTNRRLQNVLAWGLTALIGAITVALFVLPAVAGR